MKVKIIGAGSIGNHLAQACRRAGWEVSVIDTDLEALRRMKEEIYPGRYGKWDDGIKLYKSKEEPKGGFDVVFIGTPPDVHLPLAIRVLKEEAPRVLQIEKPLCAPTMEYVSDFLKEAVKHPQTAIIVGFDHVLGENTLKANAFLKTEGLGRIVTIDAETRSHWSGVFKAHPWLSGPEDTYLGFWKRGGGASGEHSHALNLWQHFAHEVGAGRVKEVSAAFDYVSDNGTLYDRVCLLTLATDKGLIGRVIQDVVSNPKSKKAIMQFEKGRVEWHCDVSKTLDQVYLLGLGEGKEQKIDIAKTRPDEFFREIEHIGDILSGKINMQDSPVRLERGLDTMAVLAAAHQSFADKKIVQVKYDW